MRWLYIFWTRTIHRLGGEPPIQQQHRNSSFILYHISCRIARLLFKLTIPLWNLYKNHNHHCAYRNSVV
jgi:hypothetical protein